MYEFKMLKMLFEVLIQKTEKLMRKEFSIGKPDVFWQYESAFFPHPHLWTANIIWLLDES